MVTFSPTLGSMADRSSDGDGSTETGDRMYRKPRSEMQLISVLCALLLLGCSRTSTTVEPFDRSTPDSVILAFYDAFSHQDAALFGAVCAVDPEAEKAAEQTMHSVIASGIHYEVHDIEWDVITHDEGTLRIKTYYRQLVTMNGEVIEEAESGGWLTLIQKDGEWYVLCLQP